MALSSAAQKREGNPRRNNQWTEMSRLAVKLTGNEPTVNRWVLRKIWDSTHPCGEQSEWMIKRKGTGGYKVIAWLMKPEANWLIVALLMMGKRQ
jgi:hypothetical protein